MKHLLFFLTFLATSCTKKDIETVNRFTKGNAFIINGGDNSISIVDLNTFKEKERYYISSFGNTFAHHIYFSKDFSKISIALPEYDFSTGHSALHFSSPKGNIFILNTNSRSFSSFPVSFANHNAVFSYDSKEIWTSLVAHSGKIQIFDSENFSLIKEISVGPDPSDVLFAKNGDVALVACGETSFLTVIDAKNKNLIKEIKIDPFPTGVSKGWSEEIVFVENANNKSLNIVDVNKFNVVDFIDFNFSPGSSIFNSKTNEIWVCDPIQNKVHIFGKIGENWNETKVIDTENDPHQILFFNNYLRAIIVNQKSNTAQFIDTITKKEIGKIVTGLKPNGVAIWE